MTWLGYYRGQKDMRSGVSLKQKEIYCVRVKVYSSHASCSHPLMISPKAAIQDERKLQVTRASPAIVLPDAK